MTAHESTTGSRGTFGGILASSLRHGSALWLLALFVIVFSFTAPATFPTLLTVQIVLSDHVTTALLALAILVPLCGGNFDFSVGALMALGMALTGVLTNYGVDVLPAAIIAIALTAFCGFVSGFIMVKLNVNSFIATLGVSQVATALTLLVTQNKQIVVDAPYWFIVLTQGKLLGVSFDVYYLLGIAVVLWYLLEHTAIGRSLFAAGGNPEAARLAGVRVNRLAWGSMVISGAIAGLAGVLMLSKVSVYTQEYGPSFLFAAFAAVFFGATQIKGRPNLWGTLIALYVLAVAVAGLQLTFFGNEYWITPLFNGVALLIAVSLAARKHAGRLYKKLRRGQSPTPEDSEKIDDTGPAIPATLERNGE